jgi:tRNA pseudouridine38-40 synthase
LLTVAYDGQGFSGWAPQQQVRTIAGELHGAIAAVDPHASRLRAVSRTDAGVHARGQLAALDTVRDIDPRGWVLALNQNLPPQIGVIGAAVGPTGFDPRDHVVNKRYRYDVHLSQVNDPLLSGRAWRVGYRLDFSAMVEELQHLAGQHDFAAYRSSADVRSETVRRILRAEVRRTRRDAELLELRIEGDHFLHNMVRIIAGTLVDVGRGHLSRGAFQRAFRSGRRGDLGMTAPPDGLYLEAVELSVCPGPVWPLAAGQPSSCG